jgi:outer membrane protein assembly factor BamB
MPGFHRWIAALTLAIVAASAYAELTGPTPLAWRWTQPTAVPPGGEPVVEGEVVYVAVGGRVYALDKEAGTQRWRYPAGEPMQANFRTGVVLAEGLVIAAADNNLVYAVDARTGAARWQYVAPAPVLGTPQVVGGLLAFALADNSLMAINLSDGTAAWRAPQRVPEGIIGSIATHGGAILMFTQTNELVSIDVTTTRVNWRTRFSFVEADARPVVFGDQIFANSGEFLVCLGAHNGRQRWQANTTRPLLRNPAVSAAGVFVTTLDGRGLLYDLNGRPINRPAPPPGAPAPQVIGLPLLRNEIDLESQPVADPRIFGGFVVIPTANGALNLIDIASASIVWSYIARPINRPRLGDTTRHDFVQAASSPTLAGNTLLMLTRDGSVFAFDRDTGVDLTPPDVQMLFPNSGEQVSGQPPLEMIWLVSDEGAGINPRSVNVSIDGAAAEFRLLREGFLVVRIGEGTRNQPLTDGRKSLEVVARDWLGNERRATFTLTIDNTLPPFRRPGAAPPREGAPGRGGGGGLGGMQ